MLVVLRITGLGQHFSAARTWPPKPSRLRCKIGVPSRPTARQKHIPSTCRRQTFGINRIRSLPFHQVASVCSSLNRVRWRKRLVRSISVSFAGFLGDFAVWAILDAFTGEITYLVDDNGGSEIIFTFIGQQNGKKIYDHFL